MDDIVDRLRDMAWRAEEGAPYADALREAAEEIKRLRAETMHQNGDDGCSTTASDSSNADMRQPNMGDVWRDHQPSDDVVSRLRDFAEIVQHSQGQAVMVMLSGDIFVEAADEIEVLRFLCNQLGDTLQTLGEQSSFSEIDVVLEAWREYNER